jgi:hypothetical protein
MKAKSASHSRAADAVNVSSTVCKSNVERLMTLSTSAVAACRSNDSFSSRVSRATSVSWLTSEELRGCTAFRAIRLLRAGVLRRRTLIVSSLVPERRLIGSP